MKKKMTDQEYFSLDACNASILKKIHFKSVLHATQPEKDPSESMILGSAFHCMVLESTEFSDRYAVYPEKINGEKPDYRKTDHKKFRERFDIRNEGKKIISHSDFTTLSCMEASLKTHPLYDQLLTKGEAETAIIMDSDEPEAVKIKMDYHIPRERIIVDLKKCQSAAPQDVRRDIYKLGYDIQAAFYSVVYHAETGHKPTFVFCFVESEPPYSCLFVQLGPEMLAEGLRKVLSAHDKYLEYRASGVAKSYSDEIVVL